MKTLGIVLVAGFFVLLGIIYLIFRRRRKVWIFRRIKETPNGKSTSYFIQGINREFKSQEEAEHFARSLK